MDDAPAAKIELLYIDGCPNHGALLERLQRLLASRHIECTVQVIRVTDDEDAQRLRFLGSPSLRVNDRDVEPEAFLRNGFGVQCRLYRTPEGAEGTLPDVWILAALDR